MHSLLDRKGRSHIGRQTFGAGRLECILTSISMIALCALPFSGCSDSAQKGSLQQGMVLRGFVRSGIEPVRGATLSLYSAGITGRSVAAPLLKTPVKTDTDGAFIVALDFACPANTSQIYIVAAGGNAGGSPAQESSRAMMASLGACGSISSYNSIVVNEVTTVASVWALAPYMQSFSAAGTAAADQGSLAKAFSLSQQLADIRTGSAPGVALSLGSTVPVSKIDWMANILGACESEAGGSSGSTDYCGKLFSLTTLSGEASPANVLEAAFSMARNPTSRVQKLFVLSSRMGAFQPTLYDAPADLRIAVTSPNSLGAASLPAGFSGDANTGTTLKFYREPANSTAGSLLNTISVLVDDSEGNLVTSPESNIVLSLRAGGPAGRLVGTLERSSDNGQATFFNVTETSVGAKYQLVATSSGLSSATSTSFDVAPVAAAAPSDSVFAFTPPATNLCQSLYDQFYIAEPGVYAFWGLCEPGVNAATYDYAGKNDLVIGKGAWSSGSLTGGVAGPLADKETAVEVATASAFLEAQGIPLNTNAGSIATWINTDATTYGVSAVLLSAVSGSSSVSISVNQDPTSKTDTLCYAAHYQNALGVIYSTQQCGFTPNVWHRVAMTWSGGMLSLYVDGAGAVSQSYSGSLDNAVFYYKLFPGCCNTGKQMTLAKALVSNQAWSAAQAEADAAPSLISPPAGGVYVSGQALGTIHRDVLGYADDNSDLSQTSLVSALLSGLQAGGFASLRYAGGYGGINADEENWQGGASCTFTQGVTAPAANLATANNLDAYMTKIAQPLGLHLGYTVNYGTNPPACNAGGDPVANGANLVSYANKQKQYGIKYWEIGNEEYAAGAGGSEPDFHANPGSGASYVQNERVFSSDMKAVDSSILIGVPIGEADYAWQSTFDLPVLAGASYDAIVWHNYPMIDPITDGSTIYQDRVSANMKRTRGTLLKLQTELLSNGKSPDAIWATEWSGDVNGDEWSRQTMGAVMPIFATIQLAEYMQAGVQYASWWAQGTSNSCYKYYYDASAESTYNWADCGSAALTYTGALPGQIEVGLVPGDITPAARAFQILAQSGFVSEGEHMLRTQADVQGAPWLMSYAATHGSSYAVILINRDRDSAHTVPVVFAGKASGASSTQWTYGRAQYDQTYSGDWSGTPVQTTSGAWSGSYAATLPPWSVNVILLGP